MDPIPQASRSENAFQHAWRSPWLRFAVFVTLIALAVWLSYRLSIQISNVIAAALISYTVAYLMNPLAVALEKRRFNRLAAVMIMLLVFGAVIGLTVLLIIAVINQIAQLLTNLPAWITQLNNWALDLLARYADNPMFADIQRQATEAVQGLATQATQAAVPLVQNLLAPGGVVLSSVLSVGNVLVQILLILVLSIYMITSFDKVGLTLLRLLPRKWQPEALDLSEDVSKAVGGYLRGQLLISLFVGVFVTVGLTLLGIPNALAIGFLAGALNIVPYLGPIVATVPAVMLALPLGVWYAVGALLVFVMANQIEGYFLSPKILGDSTDLHPITVILALLIGLALFGLVGAIVAVPIAALGKLLLRRYYYNSDFYKNGP